MKYPLRTMEVDIGDDIVSLCEALVDVIDEFSLPRKEMIAALEMIKFEILMQTKETTS